MFGSEKCLLMCAMWEIVVCHCTATLKHVAQTVAHVQLSDHLVDVVFVLFDENGQYERLCLLDDEDDDGDDDADMKSCLKCTAVLG